MTRLLLAALMTFLATDAGAQSSEPTAPPSDVLTVDELNSVRGGQPVAVNSQNVSALSADNSGNSVSGETVTTGAVTINADAFSGFDGVGNFVMNTGNNNNLQGSISITVVLAP